MADSQRLRKFVADQEEAVEIARANIQNYRMDALSIAVSYAHLRADITTQVGDLIEWAREIEKYLKEPS